MRLWIRLLLALTLVLVTALPASAATGLPGVGGTLPTHGGESVQVTIPTTVTKDLALKPIPVAFGAVPNRYTEIDPATQFDLNGDLVADLTVTSTTLTGKNGAQVLLLDPPVLNLDQVQTVPAAGYAATAPTQLSRVYVLKLTGGGYAKFMLLQASPKVSIWFMYGTPTTSVLKADGQGGHAVLTWDPLPDAALGYNVYRYEFLDNNAYSVTLLNDFTVQGTTFTDNTALNRYYVYIAIAIKAGGTFGTQTTPVAVQVQSLQRSLSIALATGTAKLDGAGVTLDAAPVIKNGRLMVPASLLQQVGVQVTVSGGQITLVRRLENVTYTLVMTVDVPDYTWNGSSYKADVPPYMAGNVAMIPLRVAGPALAFGVTFNSTDRTATIGWFE
ncbi:MAG TPA: stalk domain-containing protein [Symbiobacteriaceae bacterium]|nr:stalk domain-containing protein [Symbiobacteriaceae bacterium]